jgi:CRISPR type IV-associated protein Csf3
VADLTDGSVITGPNNHQPFTVMAELAAGIALGGGWGLALDALLAAEIWAEQKARLHAAGRVTTRLVDTDDVPDMDLPLSTCRASDGRWHWAATCAVPRGVVDGHERDIRYWTGRMDERTYRQTTAAMPGTVATHQGRWRNRIMPVIVTMCQRVSWRGVGDVEQVGQLLAPIAAIGKKRSQGEGRVLVWQVEPTDGNPWEFGHLNSQGLLGRPALLDCLGERRVIHGGSGVAGLRPPYLHASRQHQLLLPGS